MAPAFPVPLPRTLPRRRQGFCVFGGGPPSPKRVLTFPASCEYFAAGASKHLYSLAARRPVRVAFFAPPFWRNLCLILRVWANTRPACRKYARRSKDGFEHPEFSILKAPIKKSLECIMAKTSLPVSVPPPDAASLPPMRHPSPPCFRVQLRPCSIPACRLKGPPL